MRRPRLLALSILALVGLLLAGCAKSKPRAETVEKAATIIPIPGTNRVQVRLTPEAVKRLDVHTGTVRDQAVAPRPTAPVDGAPASAPALTVRRVIPFAALLYAPAGDAFTYVNVQPDLYERTSISVDYVVGDLAVLSAGPPTGPPVGTAVVTVGGPELSGAEFGVGE
ncbi:MAG: hypothetical protein QOJ52_2406 [Acidimicrobiaceae bacterium]|nr:hypothetical protein [Acidimicrobiaceae bacterium]